MNKEARTDADGLRIQSYQRKRGEMRPLQTDDQTAILDIAISSLEQNRSGRPAAYPMTEAGLQRFKDDTISYFQHVQEVNQNSELEKKLIPDIESWAVYCGVTRQTIFGYERRGGEWTEFIRLTKEAILSAKKQLAMTFRIPPIVAIFDMTNNHNYVNTNKIEVSTDEKTAEVERVESAVSAAGLIWDEDRGEYVPEGTADNVDG